MFIFHADNRMLLRTNKYLLSPALLLYPSLRTVISIIDALWSLPSNFFYPMADRNCSEHSVSTGEVTFDLYLDAVGTGSHA